MRKKYLYVLICFLVSTLATANAANRTITGVVISGEDNEPLIGASVYVNADDLKKAGVSQTSLGTISREKRHRLRMQISIDVFITLLY